MAKSVVKRREERGDRTLGKEVDIGLQQMNVAVSGENGLEGTGDQERDCHTDRWRSVGN